MPKILLLSSVPALCDPARHILMGPWCLAGMEEIYPNWENLFLFAPEPFDDEQSLEEANIQAKALIKSVLPSCVARISPSSSLPMSYWETLLMPWLVIVAQQIVERSHRFRKLKEQFSDTELEIPVLDVEKSSFHFASENDLTFHGALGSDFNFYLFSWLFTRSDLPSKWHLLKGGAVTHDYAKHEERLSPCAWLKRQARILLRKLPMPHIKGFSLFQSLSFSLALLTHSPDEDRSRLLSSMDFPRDIVDKCLLPRDTEDIIFSTLPKSIQNLRHPSHIARSPKKRLRCASIEAYEESEYRQSLAYFRAQGNCLFFMQHGGNYGFIPFSTAASLVEYTQHAFLTWGWKSQGKNEGNFFPLPSPQLAKIRNAHHAEKETLLFVGTEMPLYGYRLDAHPNPTQIVEYRQSKLIFFRNLPKSILEKTSYRPYFPVPSCLEDARYVQKNFPQVRLCKGALLPALLGTKMLVLDHHGTTLLEAMAANVPTLLYWNPRHWMLCDEAQDMLEKLSFAGIFHSSPEACARALEKVWPNVNEWWHSPLVQETRKSFCMSYARIDPKTLYPLWIQNLHAL